MKPNNIIQDKSYAFALRTVFLYKFLTEKREFILSKQVLRSGTSIGANVEEAIGCHSRKEFAAKMSIAYKEARETLYWIRLLRDSKSLDKVQSSSMIADCDEILRIIGSIIKTLKSKNSTPNS
jgi:four helix bundle protein